MPIGRIINLVHLSQQTYQPTSRLIAGHNEKGYGTIQGSYGQQLYFSHDAVPDRHGFDNLRRGQFVEYTVDPTSRFSANSVIATIDEVDQRQFVDFAETDVTSFPHVARTFRRPIQARSVPQHPLDGYPQSSRVH
jgi:cold shock CspA family protein